ncbi:nudC domain-containing protein 3-like, partial [Leptopilina boulardi]|uniref:nudC domain-containing protein 3-like n=1 Tax=Leptopilina boulardi TaxID=63433 RepID=UPI0021F5FF9C
KADEENRNYRFSTCPRWSENVQTTDFYVKSNVKNEIDFENLLNEYNEKWKIKSKTYFDFKEPVIFSKIENTISQCVEKIDECKNFNKQFTEQTSDSYNGAVRENYTWSQTISDLNVIVKIPQYVKSINQLRISVASEIIKIDIKNGKFDYNEIEWITLLSGQFYFKIRKDESYWSFVSGQHIIIHLEKTVERWWEALILGEAKIELAKIDCTRNLDELGDAEQMKLEELIWNHQQKLLKNSQKK